MYNTTRSIGYFSGERGLIEEEGESLFMYGKCARFINYEGECDTKTGKHESSHRL